MEYCSMCDHLMKKKSSLSIKVQELEAKVEETTNMLIELADQYDKQLAEKDVVIRALATQYNLMFSHDSQDALEQSIQETIQDTHKRDVCNQIVLTKPDWLTEEHPEKHSECLVDSCISECILDLWTHEIATVECCCGHRRKNPSVVVPSLDDAIYAKQLLSRIDSRNWDILHKVK